MDSNFARMIAIVVGVIGAFFASLFAAFQTRPDVPGRIVMATGNTTYHTLAETWREDLERNGVKLDLRRTVQGFDALKAVADPASEVNAAFVKGGVVGSMQGKLAGTKSKEWRGNELEKLRSVGRLMHEPIWIFSRGDVPITRLAELRGRRVLVGLRQSGTRRIANQLLRANGLDRNSVTLIEEELTPDASHLREGKADVGILIEPPDTDRIQALLRVPNIRLMNFDEEATAYTNRFPALTKVVMPVGSVEFNPLIPSADITLLSTTVALVVRSTMDPALVNLLTYTVINHPRSGFDKNGDPILFYKAGEFPNASDPEFTVARDARQLYKTGEMPLILRLSAPVNERFGVPFSVTAFMAAHGAKLVLLIPAAAVLLPLMRGLPAFYAWIVRRRLLYWYGQLKKLERQVYSTEAFEHLDRSRAEIDRIDAGVRRLRVPLAFSDRLYDLRGHTDLVRQQLYAHRVVAKAAAE